MLSQAEVAEAVDVSKFTVYRWERGEEPVGVHPKTARRLTEVLGARPEELLADAPTPTPEAAPDLELTAMFEASHADRQRALGAASASELERYLAEVEEHKERSEALIVETVAEANNAREELRDGYESELQQRVNYVYRLGQMRAEAEAYLPTHASVEVLA
jgi:transcriptional regulator with XRE-family HTH domain